jgi:tetratricopeptide (TPR) repeat protein
VTQAAPAEDAGPSADDVQRVLKAGGQLTAALLHGPRPDDEAAVAQAAGLLEDLAGFVAAGWDIGQDVWGLMAAAQVLMALDGVRGDHLYEADMARLLLAAQALVPEPLPQDAGEYLEVTTTPGNAWSAIGNALLMAADEIWRPGFLDAAIVAARRAAASDLSGNDRLAALQTMGLAAIALYVREGTGESREEMAGAVLGLPENAPAHAKIHVAAGESLLQWGERRADLAAHRLGEEIVRRALAAEPGERDRTQLLLLLRALRCHRALLADPDLAGEPASLESRPRGDDADDGILSAHEDLAAVMPHAIEAALANTALPPGLPTVADVAEGAGAHHWRRFLEARGADGSAEPMEGVEIVVIPFDGEERVDMVMHLPGNPAAQQELNAAAMMFVLVAAERPAAVPEEIRPACATIAESADGLAWMAIERTIELLEANDREPDPDAVHAAVLKLTRMASSPLISPRRRDFLAALLGDSLIRLYAIDRDPATLARAVAVLRRTANCGREVRRRSRRNLVEALSLCHQLGDEDALEETIAQLRSLIAEADPEAEDLVSLASALQIRFRASRRPSDRAEMTALLKKALAADLESEVRRRAHTMLGEALEEGYEASEDLAVLIEAIGHRRSALELTPPGLPEHRLTLLRMASGLHKQFQRTSDLAVLEEASRLSTQLCQDLDPSDALDLMLLLNHANIVGTVSEQTGEAETLPAILPLLRAAAAAHAETPELLVMVLDKIALVLRQLWETGEPVDLQEALDAARGAVEIATSEPDPVAYIGNLAHLLMDVYRVRGERELQDEAIALLRDAMKRSEGQPRDRRLAQLNLAADLVGRGQDRGDTAVLREAIDLLRELVDLSAGHAEHAIVLSNLGGALTKLHEREPENTDLLPEAVNLLRRSVSLSEGRHQHDRHLSNLGQALGALSDARQEPAMLEQSLELSARAMALVPPGHPLRSSYQLAHANLLLARRTKHGDGAAGEEALDLLFEIVRSDASGPLLSAALCQIGDLVLWAVDAVGDPRFEREKVAPVPLFRWAATLPTATAHQRAKAARSWGLTALRIGEVADALEALTLVLEMVDAAAAGDLETADQERWLSAFRGTARLAAACAIQLGEPETAVELLERGRGVVLGRTLAARRQIRRLRAVAPELADALAGVEAAAADLAAMPPALADPVAAGTRNARRVQLEEERRALLARIHELPGLEELGLPPRISALRAAAAAEGPVVIVNVSPLRCDALLVERDGVRVVPLPDLGEDELGQRAELFVAAMEILGRDEGIGLELALAARRIMFGTLTWLWDAVAEPVLEALGITGTAAEPPRLWWCPTGDLSFLPLHAAGRHQAGGGFQTVLDRVVSSYAPTLRSLAEAADADPSDDDALMVAVSESRHADGMPTLEVDGDLAAFAARFPEGQVLRDEAATADQVLAALREATVVHLAAHAHQDIGNPSAGCIDLWDRQVTVAELRGAIGKPGRLAMLLGCETARGGRRLADETISLTTALQHAGFQHTVGTMWPIDDSDAERVAAAVHAAQAPAQAVADAVRALRDERPMAPNRWAGLVHVGP